MEEGGRVGEVINLDVCKEKEQGRALEDRHWKLEVLKQKVSG